jgi:hypothetical protein
MLSEFLKEVSDEIYIYCWTPILFTIYIHSANCCEDWVLWLGEGHSLVPFRSWLTLDHLLKHHLLVQDQFILHYLSVSFFTLQENNFFSSLKSIYCSSFTKTTPRLLGYDLCFFFHWELILANWFSGHLIWKSFYFRPLYHSEFNLDTNMRRFSSASKYKNLLFLLQII